MVNGLLRAHTREVFATSMKAADSAIGAAPNLVKIIFLWYLHGAAKETHRFRFLGESAARRSVRARGASDVGENVRTPSHLRRARPRCGVSRIVANNIAT